MYVSSKRQHMIQRKLGYTRHLNVVVVVAVGSERFQNWVAAAGSEAQDIWWSEPFQNGPGMSHKALEF